MFNSINKPLLISIVGATAVGKTSLAIKIALKLKSPVISADSRQMYKELNKGTAKPSSQELEKVPHYFINSHSIHSPCSAGKYGNEARDLISHLFESHKHVIVVGGSGLYLKALWEGFDDMPDIDYTFREILNQEFQQKGLSSLLEELRQVDPQYFNKVDKKNPKRIIRALEVFRSTGKPFSLFRKGTTSLLPYHQLKIGLKLDQVKLRKRIEERIDSMIANGLFEEVKSLYEYKDLTPVKTLGYSEIFGFLDGMYQRNEAIDLFKKNTRQYAKRQIKWFKRYHDIVWFEAGREEELVKLIENN